MLKPIGELSQNFKPTKYLIERNSHSIQLTLTGQKLARPSYRISLHQSGLKIIKAKIVRFDKQVAEEIELKRISHLPTFEQVRLHSKTILYPGRYQIDIEYTTKPENISKFGLNELSRKLVPSIDDVASWQSAEVEIKP